MVTQSLVHYSLLRMEFLMQNKTFDALYPYHKQKRSFLYLVAGLFLYPSLAFAYIGPGLGAGAIALIVIIAFSIILAVFSLVWYPLKAKMKQKKLANDDAQNESDQV